MNIIYKQELFWFSSYQFTEQEILAIVAMAIQESCYTLLWLEPGVIPATAVTLMAKSSCNSGTKNSSEKKIAFMYLVPDTYLQHKHNSYGCYFGWAPFAG